MRGFGAGASILLVEDDPETLHSVAQNLAAHGYVVAEAGDAASAAERWDQRRPDLVLVDLGLPDVDGLAVIRRVRREAATPILVVSARDRERDKIEALELGADDYVTKPFGMGELHARIHALLRRALGPAADAAGRIVSGPLVMDLSSRLVTVGGQSVRLTPREYELLKVLLSNAGRVVTRAHLLRAVWGAAYADESHYLHVYISQLRHKLAAADPSGTLGDLIANEPGIGYRVRDLTSVRDRPS